MEQVKEQRSLGELFSELTHETRTLLRQEVNLAKTELVEKISEAQKGLISVAIGGLVAFIGLIALTAAAICGLAYVMEWWLAALIVGVVVLAIGLIVLSVGRAKLKGENLTLSRTTQTLQEDKRWAQAQMHQMR